MMFKITWVNILDGTKGSDKVKSYAKAEAKKSDLLKSKYAYNIQIEKI